MYYNFTQVLRFNYIKKNTDQVNLSESTYSSLLSSSFMSIIFAIIQFLHETEVSRNSL